jgi:hypothetical protein
MSIYALLFLITEKGVADPISVPAFLDRKCKSMIIEYIYVAFVGLFLESKAIITSSVVI